MPVLSCLRPAADAPVAMEDEDEYPTTRRARAFSRLVDAPAHDTSDFASTATTHKRYNFGKGQAQAAGRRGKEWSALLIRWLNSLHAW